MREQFLLARRLGCPKPPSGRQTRAPTSKGRRWTSGQSAEVRRCAHLASSFRTSQPHTKSAGVIMSRPRQCRRRGGLYVRGRPAVVLVTAWDRAGDRGHAEQARRNDRVTGVAAHRGDRPRPVRTVHARRRRAPADAVHRRRGRHLADQPRPGAEAQQPVRVRQPGNASRNEFWQSVKDA